MFVVKIVFRQRLFRKALRDLVQKPNGNRQT